MQSDSVRDSYSSYYDRIGFNGSGLEEVIC